MSIIRTIFSASFAGIGVFFFIGGLALVLGDNPDTDLVIGWCQVFGGLLLIGQSLILNRD